VESRALSDQPDIFRWKWASSGQYSASSAYRAFFLGLTEQLGAKQLWKIRAPNKCHFFLWLVLPGRCWTSERLHRHGLPNQGNCALCSQEVESIEHLLVRCVYSREVWFRVLRQRQWQALVPSGQEAIVDWWLASRKRVHKPFRANFDSIFALVSWQFWNERNVRVFRQTSSLPHKLTERIVEELQWWSSARLVAHSPGD
jgi:hypothetical protein